MVAAVGGAGPRDQRCFLVVMAIVTISLTGGVIYGWPSMRRILRRDMLLLDPSCSSDLTIVCDEQERSFGLIFTMGAWCNQGGRFFIGILLDRFGPKRTTATCAACYGLGCLLFGLFTSLAPLVIGMSLIGLGGAGTQLAVQSVSSLFPRNKSLVMASLSGAFQAAVGLYLLFEVLHTSGIPRLALLLTHAGVTFTLALTSLFVWPHTTYGLQRTAQPTTVIANAQASAASTEAIAVDAMAPEAVSVTAAASTSAPTMQTPKQVVPLQQRDFRGQATSPEFLLLLAYFSINALQCQFTVSTVGLQFELKRDADAAAAAAAAAASGALEGLDEASSGTSVDHITRVFSLCQTLSFLVTPAIGSAFDRLGFAPSFFGINTLNLLVPVMLLLPSLDVQFFTCFVYAAGRVGLWSSFFAFTGATFGFKHYGKMAGGGLLVQSLICLLVYPLLAATLALDRDFTMVNALFLGLTTAQYATIFALHRLTKRG